MALNILPQKKIIWVYLLSLLFIGVNAYFISKESYYFNLVPFALIAIMLAIFSLKRLFFITVFFVPLSIPLKELFPGLPFDMFLPTEPLLFGILIIFILKLLIEGTFDKKILLHPISIAIYVNLFWLLITSITSTIPLVSIKFLLARMWFLASFYFIATQVFKDYKNINLFSWAYIIPLMYVIGYTIYRHTSYGLNDQQAAHFVMTPFYNDHTSYGAILAMFIPVIFGFIFYKKYNPTIKTLVWGTFLIFTMAIILSYTRAAWISLVAAIAIWIILLLKIKFRYIIISLVVLFGLFFTFQTQIFMALEQNRQDSSADFFKHIQSITNISSDASNLERINRWNSAIRMFNEKPFLGWGPGTYQFKYAPFQFSYEKTIISTNAGDMGNAHSEYIGPLSESGVLGMLTFLAIVITVAYTAIRLYRKAVTKEIRLLALIYFLGLSTYFLHGFLNNFLDTDKLSAPFWGFIAILVALEVYHNKTSY